MKLVVNSKNKVVASHANTEDITNRYPSGYSIVLSDDVSFDIKEKYEQNSPEEFISRFYRVKIEEIKKSFNDDIASGYVSTITSDHTGEKIKMDADYNSILLLDGACKKADRTGREFIDICDFNNFVHTNVYNSYVDKILMGNADNYQAKMRHKWDKRTEILEASIEQLDSITWES